MGERSRSSLLFWHPKIINLDVPSPRTEIVRLTAGEVRQYAEFEGDILYLEGLSARVAKTIKSKFSLPVFLRTDEFSYKHKWKDSCFLGDAQNLASHLAQIISGSREAGIIGLPIEAIAIREFIPMDTRFYAFNGDMPVNSERRYFIRDGKIVCHHPYWVEDAIEEWASAASRTELPSNWKDMLRGLNLESAEEKRLLTGYSEKVAKSISGYWSVDFCRAKDGRWWLIDMAEGDKSWHPSECKYSKMPARRKVSEEDLLQKFFKSG
jgi:hypothetical protein